MEFLYGKLNKEIELVNYKGLSTSTAQVSIDNENNTIKVDVIGGVGNGSNAEGALFYSKNQNLNDVQLKQLYSNFKLLKYLDTNSLLQVKDNQEIQGNLRVRGSLTSTDNYLVIENQEPLNANTNTGILIKNWMQNKNAKIYLTNKGELRFDTGVSDQQILTKHPDMNYNKFTYYNGQSLSSRDIRPMDIYTKDYEPINSYDLATKSFTEKAAKEKTTYRVVKDQEAFNSLTGIYKGLRVHITGEVN